MSVSRQSPSSKLVTTSVELAVRALEWMGYSESRDCLTERWLPYLPRAWFKIKTVAKVSKRVTVGVRVIDTCWCWC